MSLMLFRIAVAGVVFVESFRAVRAFEIMAFAGHSHQGNGHQQQGKKFHRGVS
jgi:hypothetical protein